MNFGLSGERCFPLMSSKGQQRGPMEMSMDIRLVRIDDLTDDTYIFDEETFALRGVNNKRGYRLGDKVKIVVKAANKEAKTIDFLIAEEQHGNKQ